MKPDAANAEARLVLLAMAGDEAAFHELVLRRQAWLRSLLRRLCGDGALADDLSQETFLRAWRGIAQLEGHAAFGAWLRRIAVRVWSAELHRQRLRFQDTEIDDIAMKPKTGGVETADQRMDVQSALAQLRVGPRACVILFYGEGMSHSEIAGATGLSIGVVKSHIARATRRLRILLKDWNDDV